MNAVSRARTPRVEGGSTCIAVPAPSDEGIRYSVPARDMCGLYDRNAFGLEHGHEGDERQADQRRRVVRHDALRQRNAPHLHTRAAGAIVGLFQFEVAL